MSHSPFLMAVYTVTYIVPSARKREIPITEDMAAVLTALLAESKCEYVFTSLHDHSQPLSAHTLADQHRTIMATCSLKIPVLLSVYHSLDCGTELNEVGNGDLVVRFLLPRPSRVLELVAIEKLSPFA